MRRAGPAVRAAGVPLARVRRGERPRLILFTGCLVQQPARVMRGRVMNVTRRAGFQALHTFGEMLQLLDVLAGTRTIPPELRDYCAISEKFGRHAVAPDLSDVDLAIIEPSSPVDIVFRGVYLNRGASARALTKAMGGGKDARELAVGWAKHATLGRKPQVAEKLRDAVLAKLAADTEKAALARTIVEGVQTQPSDIAAGFRALRARIACPMAIAAYTFRYMPDGRPVPWPHGFREQVFASAAELGLPLFDPAPLVAQFGVDRALKHDQGHYDEPFIDVVGVALAEFVDQVLRTARAAKPDVATPALSGPAA